MATLQCVDIDTPLYTSQSTTQPDPHELLKTKLMTMMSPLYNLMMVWM